MGFEVGGAEGKCAVERMLLVIGAGAINRLVGGGIHEDLAGACEELLRLGCHRFDDRADTVWWVIIVVIHDYDDIPRCLLSEIVELGAHRKPRLTLGIVEGLFTEVDEEVLDGLSTIVKDKPLHQVVVIVLLLVDLNEPRNELGPVVGRCDDGDEHWYFVWAALAVQF